MATISKEHDKNTDLTRFALAYVVDKESTLTETPPLSPSVDLA